MSEARVVHSFGRADRLDRPALERLVRSIRRVLDADAAEPGADAAGHDRRIEIEASFELGVVHDVTTVERIKEDLRQMRLGRALFVGDVGLCARANLVELSRGVGRYILAPPIGRVKEIRNEVLSRPGRYAQITPNLRAKEVIVGQASGAGATSSA